MFTLRTFWTHLKSSRLLLPCMLILGLLGGAVGFLPQTAFASGTAYYVDCSAGSDGNGTQASPWNSLNDVNSFNAPNGFAPGDSILLQAGTACAGGLSPAGSGSNGNPIKIGAYGSGNAPVINGNGAVSAGITLTNQSYWTIQGLTITNDNTGSPTNISGIEINATVAGTYSGITISNNTIYNVYGSNSHYYNAGIVVISNTPEIATNYDHLTISNNTIYDTDTMGISIIASTNSNDQTTSMSNWDYNTNVTVTQNTIHHVKYDAILVGASDTPLITYNASHYDGYDSNNTPYTNDYIAAIWTYTSKNAWFEYNEVDHTQASSGDGEAFDCDWGGRGTCNYEYNYVHDNPKGFLLVCCSQGTSGSAQNYSGGVIRYNVTQNMGGYFIPTYTSNSVPFDVYNNTFYEADNTFQSGQSAGTASNNIVVAAGGTLCPGGVICQNNLFYGGIGSAGSNALAADPLLSAPNSGADGFNSASGYQLQTGSPALNSGTLIANNGGVDFFGNAVSSSSNPNVGAYNGSGVGSTMTNVALNQSAFASSSWDDNYGPSMGVDGNIATGWSSSASDTAPWWEVDLGQAYRLSQIQVVMRQDADQPGTRDNFAIWASNNRSMASGHVVLCSQGSTVLPYQSTFSCDVGDTTAYRYVAYIKTDDAYSFFAELRVNAVTSDIALNQSTSASSSWDDNYGPSMGVDGNIATGWSSSASDTAPWWEVDLGQAYQLSQIQVVTRQDADQPGTRANFAIWASNNLSMAQGHTVLCSQGSTPLAYQATFTCNVTDTTAYRYIAYIKTDNAYSFFAEMQVYAA